MKQFKQVIIKIAEHIEDNLHVVREREIVYFHFDLPKVGKNLKHGLAFTTKHNESLAERKIKNKIDQLSFKHKYENNIHEHRKQ